MTEHGLPIIRPHRHLRSPAGPFFSLACLVIGSLLIFSAGCATHEQRLLAIRDGFYSGDLIEAETALDEGLKRDRRDGEVLLLERSIVDLADGRPQDAEK